MSTDALADVRARVSSSTAPDEQRIRTDCRLLIDEVDRLEYELRLAHGKLAECVPKKKKRAAATD